MLDFQFYSPTKFYFGKNAESNVATGLKEFGAKKVLIHYGGQSAKKSGLLDRVKNHLHEASIEFVELGGVVPNPRIELVYEGIELCRKEEVDFILAVGGGSVADSAKAIAVGVPYEGDVWDFYRRKAVVNKALKVATIITLAATGSEASNSSVITNENDTDVKKTGINSDLIRPVISMLNPELTFTLPAFQIAAGATDMLSHCLERYITNTEYVDLTDRMLEAVMQSILIACPQALRNREDYEAHATLMWAGTIAHNNVLGVGREQDWSSHQIEHALSAFNDVTHGAGLAIIFPAFMKYTLHTNMDRYSQFATRVMGVPADTYNKEAVALEGIQRLENFFGNIGMPTRLHEIEVEKDNLSEIVSYVRMNGDSLGQFQKLNLQDIHKILEIAL